MSTSVAVLSKAFTAVYTQEVPYLEVDSIIVLSKSEFVAVNFPADTTSRGTFAVVSWVDRII
jgi:hypothetical protein